MSEKTMFTREIIHRANARLMALENINDYKHDPWFEPLSHEELEAAFRCAYFQALGKEIPLETL